MFCAQTNKNVTGNMQEVMNDIINDDIGGGGTKTRVRLRFSHYYCTEVLEAAKMIVNLLVGIWTLMSLILSGETPEAFTENIQVTLAGTDRNAVQTSLCFQPAVSDFLYASTSGVLAVEWNVHVPVDPVYAPLGSSVVLQCTYDFPEESDQGIRHKVLSEMWCLNQSHCITQRYVYHSAGIFPEPSYQGRVKYFGQTGSKNCSLMISDLRSADSGVYVFRFITDHLKAKLPGQRGVNLQVTHQMQSKNSYALDVQYIISC